MSPTLRRLLSYFRPHTGALAVSLLLMSIQAAIPGLLVFFIQQILDRVLIARDTAMLATLPFAFVGIYAVNGITNVGRGLLTKGVAWAVVTRLRRELFVQYLRLDAGWHQSHPVGERVARLVNDVTSIQHGVSGIVTAVQKPLTLAVLIATAFYLNPRLALIAVAVLPFVAVPIDRFGRRLRQTSRQSLNNMSGLSASSTETLNGIRVVQAFSGEAQQIAKFDVQNELQRKLQLKVFAAQLFPSAVVELIASLGIGLCIWFGGRQVFRGELTPGELIAFMIALALVNDPLKGISLIQSMIQRAMAGAEVVFEILDTEPSVRDDGTLTLSADEVVLAFESVDFSYEADRPVLSSVSFEVGRGRVVALVGSSGAGKSTAATLISRFRDPAGGCVTLNGRDLRDYTLLSLRQHVAVVSQETFLFDDTVRANIAFGAIAGAEPSDDDIVAAARAANAHDFITALPLGYETRIDELGQRLSGGQRQRICIARAVLRDAPLLVLDEATSALDAESEAAVQEALERLMADRTVIAIAHRLSTIRGADEILVLDGGHIVERGRHEALMASEGSYAALVRRQLES
ncbi:MAG: subfamily B ATP-binding cassette protein MsbA [Myxococcota bacterium]|jgi:subfamily B ATP-binding cassette protein MsbA